MAILLFLWIPGRGKLIVFVFIDNIKKLQGEENSCGNNKLYNELNNSILERYSFLIHEWKNILYCFSLKYYNNNFGANCFKRHSVVWITEW